MSTPARARSKPARTTGKGINFHTATKVQGSEQPALLNAFAAGHPEWNATQINRGSAVRAGLVSACTTLIEQIPPSGDRTLAIHHLRMAGMLANAAITHGGVY